MHQADAAEADVLAKGFLYNTVKAPEFSLPRNGIWRRLYRPPVLVVDNVQMSRDAKEIVRGGQAKTYTFPLTVTTASKCAFVGRKVLQSVRLNGRLEVLGDLCFAGTGIRQFVLSAGARNIGVEAFEKCENL